MRTRPFLVTAFVALAAGAAHAWPALRADADRPAPTLDQLIDRLAGVRAQEAELHARRAELERQVRDRLDEQARRLQQVGVSPAVMAAPVLPPFHAVDIDRPAPRVVSPPPPAEPSVSPGLPLTIVVQPAVASVTPDREVTSPGGLADRLDALGGLPVAYTRWWRAAAPRRASEFSFDLGAGLAGGN